MTIYAADIVIRALLSRNGFDHWWDQLDEDIQEEIKVDLNDRLYEARANGVI